MAGFYTWRTVKQGSFFSGHVLKVTVRDTPNARGHYADTTIVETYVELTRSIAKTRAQAAVRHLNRKGN